MLEHDAITIQDLGSKDVARIRRILETSEYVHCRFSDEELPRLLGQLPAVGVFSASGGRLSRVLEPATRAFLLINWIVPPSAWIGGFGVTWSESAQYEEYLDLMLPHIVERVKARGARILYYSGADLDSDWLANTFSNRGFRLVSVLRSYDKADYRVPDSGNQSIRVRPFRPVDVDQLVEIENRAFPQLWRHDANSFLDVTRTYPYFVVAEDETGILGYQFNTVENEMGFLVRIAVHPRAEGMGVGTRLMAEAVRYFQQHHVWKIVLNTEETNTRAHRLYEWFGFERVEPRGFVLGLDLASQNAGK